MAWATDLPPTRSFDLAERSVIADLIAALARNPLHRMAVRLDVSAAATRRAVLAALGQFEPDLVLANWGEIADSVAAAYLDGQLSALDIAIEYLEAVALAPVVVGSAPFLGQVGTLSLDTHLQNLEQALRDKLDRDVDPETAVAEVADQAAESAGDEVAIVGRDSVATTANNDPAFDRYARQAEPTACDWCKMLAGRGAVYTAETATVTREGMPYHTKQKRRRKDGSIYEPGGRCQCVPVALKAGDPLPDPVGSRVTTRQRAAAKSAYRQGRRTTERMGSIDRQLAILRQQLNNGTATTWTGRRIVELEQERISAAMPRSLTTIARDLAYRYDPNQPRDEIGRWTDTPGVNSYEGSHNAPGRDYGAPMHDTTMMFPDLLEHPEWYATHADDGKVDRQAMAAIRKAATEGPTAQIKMYRAAPKGVTKINPGDWVTPSKTYAILHGDSNLEEGFVVLGVNAQAGDLFTEGNSIAEWGWDPAPGRPHPGTFNTHSVRRSESLRYDPNQPRDPAGTATGGQWTKASIEKAAKQAKAKAAEDNAWAQVKLNNGEASRLKRQVARDLAERMKDVPAADMAAAARAMFDGDELGMHLALDEIDEAIAAGDAIQLARDLDGNYYADYPDLQKPIPNWEYATPGTPEYDAMVREGSVAGFVSKWAQTSNDHDPGSLAVQEAIRREFGIADAANWTSEGADPTVILRNHGAVLQKFSRAMYDNTQADLAARGVTTLTIERGTGQIDFKVTDGVVTTKMRPASSWSEDPDTAQQFAAQAWNETKAAYRMRVEVPAGQVLSTPRTGVGSLAESEVVLLGGDLEVEAWML